MYFIFFDKIIDQFYCLGKQSGAYSIVLLISLNNASTVVLNLNPCPWILYLITPYI